MIAQLIETIRSCINLAPKEIDAIKTLFKSRSIKKQELFLAEGQVCKHVGFITKGLMRYYINQNGEDKTYAFAQEGDFVCNNESFIPQTASTKIIEAIEDCEILQISFNDLQTFYKTISEGDRFGRLVTGFYTNIGRPQFILHRYTGTTLSEIHRPASRPAAKNSAILHSIVCGRSAAVAQPHPQKNFPSKMSY